MIKPKILTYHSVGDGSTALSVKTSLFGEQMRYLKDNNYNILTIEEFLDTDRNVKNKDVLITFDDGYRDVFINALPILKKHGFSAVMFVNPGFVGSKASFATLSEDQKREICSKEELIELSSNNVYIANHSFSHTEMERLSGNEAVEEFKKAKDWIERNIKINNLGDVFAPPKGSWNEKIESLLKDSGLKFVLKDRIDVYPNRSLNYFSWSLNPFFRWLRANKNFILGLIVLIGLKQYFRYGLSSVVTYSVLFGGVYILVEFVHLRENIAYLIVYSFNHILLYLFSAMFVFKTEMNKINAGRFTGYMVLNWISGNVFFNLLLFILDIHYMWILFINVVILSIIRFLFLRHFVFRSNY
jgi:peptidoglycan/xylan/chitin deacetylase (PgdA/CDA1 family)